MYLSYRILGLQQLNRGSSPFHNSTTLTRAIEISDVNTPPFEYNRALPGAGKFNPFIKTTLNMVALFKNTFGMAAARSRKLAESWVCACLARSATVATLALARQLGISMGK